MALSMRVLSATKRDLDDIRAVSPELADSALAATALALAREIDQKGNSATSKSMCARALAETLAQLRAMKPTEEEGDELDAARTRRAERRGESAA